MECERVRALGNLNDHGIVGALIGIIFGKFDSQPTSLYPNGGVTLRIEAGWPTQNLGRDLVLLQADAGMIQGVFSKIT